MWVSKRELQRIEREASDCRKRESEAKTRLKEERERVDRLTLACLDLAARKVGAYPISTQIEPPPPETPETREQMIERFKLQFDAYWQGCLLTAQESNRSQDEAEDWLFRYATGQPLPYQEQEAQEM